MEPVLENIFRMDQELTQKAKELEEGKIRMKNAEETGKRYQVNRLFAIDILLLIAELERFILNQIVLFHSSEYF